MIPPDLAPPRVSAALRARRFGRSLDVRAETDSTNDDAREAALAGAPTGHVVIADRQRAGRGSRGRRWSSPGGDDLYLSLVLRPSLTPTALPTLTLAVGLGVARTVEALCPGHEVRIKWPNDVWLDRKKCAGVLVETSSRGAHLEAVIAGIGLDVNRTDFEPELEGEATSLAKISGRRFDRAEVAAALLFELERAIESLLEGKLDETLEAIDARLALRGQRARCDEHEGVVRGLGPDGSLRIETEGGVRSIRSGTLRPLPHSHRRS